MITDDCTLIDCHYYRSRAACCHLCWQNRIYFWTEVALLCSGGACNALTECKTRTL